MDHQVSAPPLRFRTRASLFSYITAHPHQLLRGRYLGHANGKMTQARVAIHTITQDGDKFKISGAIAYVRTRGTIEARFTSEYHEKTLTSFRVRMDEADLNLRAPRDGSKAGSIARPFFDSMESMKLRVEWRPNIQPLNVYGEGRLWLLGENNDPAAEYTKIECTLDASPLYQSLDEGESPISHQPISTLAMMCRYLNGGDLITVYKVNRMMSQAASHPIVHQSGQSVGVASTLFDCKSYVTDGGITCTFTDPDKMKSALSGRLLRQTRILRIRATTHVGPLSNWLQCLTDETYAPSLRALRIEAVNLAEMKPKNVHFVGSNFSTMVNEHGEELEQAAEKYLTHCPTFTQLKLIHFTLPVGVIELLIPHLPASVELLHCTFTRHGFQAGRGSLMPFNLVDYLRAQPRKLTRFIFSLYDSNWSQYVAYADLFRLCEIEQVSPVMEVHCDIRVRLAEAELLRTNLILPAHPLRLPEYSLDLEMDLDPKYIAEYLRHFAELEKLTLRLGMFPRPPVSTVVTPTPQAVSLTSVNGPPTAAAASAATSKLSQSVCVWPAAVSRTLKELHIRCPTSSLIEAVKPIGSSILPSLETLMISSASPSHYGTGSSQILPPKLLSTFFSQLPNLTCLMVPLMNFADNVVRQMEHLPQLRKLCSFEYPWRHDVNDPKVSYAVTFPSLTSLEVVNAQPAIPTHALRSIPNLKHLKWLREEWMHSREALEERFEIAETQQAEAVKAQAEKEKEKPVEDVDSILKHLMSSMILFVESAEAANEAVRVNDADSVTVQVRRVKVNVAVAKAAAISHFQAVPFEFNPGTETTSAATNTSSSTDSSSSSAAFGTMSLSSSDFAPPLFNFSNLSFGSESAATTTTSSTVVSSSSSFSSFLSNTNTSSSSSSTASDTVASAFSTDALTPSTFSFASGDAFSTLSSPPPPAALVSSDAAATPSFSTFGVASFSSAFGSGTSSSAASESTNPFPTPISSSSSSQDNGSNEAGAFQAGFKSKANATKARRSGGKR